MSNACNFKIKYDGPALSESSIAVADLAPALLNLSEALSSLNELINKDDAKVSLEVKAFNRGCFIVDFVLNLNILSQVGALFTGVAVVGICNAYTLLKCIVDVVSLKKWIAGRKVDKVTFSDDKQSVTIYIDNSTKTVNHYTYQAWKSPKVNAACSKVVEPLRNDGLESVAISGEDFEEVFTKADVDSISASPDDVTLTSNIAKCIVMIETAAFFKDSARWKVKIGEQNSAFVTISDPEFLAAIDRGTERFGKGDVLLVELESKQTLSNGKLILSHNIRKVFEHKTSAEQLSLF